jgi:hypothetical protein
MPIDFTQLAEARSDWDRLTAIKLLVRELPPGMFMLRLPQAGGVYRPLEATSDEELLNTVQHLRQQQAQAEAEAG